MNNPSNLNKPASQTTPKLPSRVRVLVLGGGIHGVGVLHDLISRGWTDSLLLEKKTVGCATSSSSTKLIHGGLRYLQRVSDFSLVYEALKERSLLLRLAPDIVSPVELVLPILKKGGFSSLTIKSGLMLYDMLAGSNRINKHRKLSIAEVQNEWPNFETNLMSTAYSFWDGQTDDLGLVSRVAESAKQFGGQICEHSAVERIKADHDGWRVWFRIHTPDGKPTDQVESISTRYIVNCMGPWSNKILEESNFQPKFKGINNKGAHLLVKDLGLKKGFFLQSTSDKRIFFVLPWMGHTLVGTTESLYKGDPDLQKTKPEDVEYLLQRVNYYLKSPITTSDIVTEFSGLRWLAIDDSKSLSATSRSHELGIHHGQSGLMLTIYGGKLTTYRSLAESIGDIILKDFGEFKESRTHEDNYWAKSDLSKAQQVPERFAQGAKG